MSDFDLARQEAAVRLAEAARAYTATLDRLRVEAFNTRVLGSLAASSALTGDAVPDEETLLTSHAALVEVDSATRDALRRWADLNNAAQWWATVHHRPPFRADLEEFYEGRRTA